MGSTLPHAVIIRAAPCGPKHSRADVRLTRGRAQDVTPASVEEVTERIVRVAIETGRRLTWRICHQRIRSPLCCCSAQVTTRRLGA